ncbi:Nitrate/nitrite sensor protein NarX [Rubripirellula tenax]|uniref:Nitrate/nitrite sensor protein NarX n=1 Tax=Rubripirellula tenax TaxID=2528015 RepID=A0A5C6EKM4_9BACT|nr:histidine kinase [Rubripirellula tenax]TWU48647.1 Nitrate/nitrite sensor protein NarX [Rubripirellula tenax]
MAPPLKLLASLILLLLCDAGLSAYEPQSNAALAANAHLSNDVGDDARLRGLSISQLEKHLVDIDSQLGRLATFSLRSGIGVIGYRSGWRGTPERHEWVEVKLDKEYSIDEVVLVPTLWRDSQKGFQSDGFPQEIRVLLGTADDPDGKVVAEYTLKDQIEPRIGPLVVFTEHRTASWVRIEATRLSTRAYDGKHIFQLAELLVFSGMENVALREKVVTSSNSNDRVGAWDEKFLVDGLTPYLMDSSEGDQSLAYVSRFGEQPILYVDLESRFSISEIHLHAVDQDDTVPQAYAGDLGVPNRLKIEGADDEDFSNSKMLLDYQRTNINDIGPTMIWRIPKTTCRFVRLSAAEPDVSVQDVSTGKRSRDKRIGFAEIELYSKGKNVALGKRAFADYQPNPGDRSLDALTDGRNLFGDILPIRTWLTELAKRHDLVHMRPVVVAELNRRYARQRVQLTWVTWLAVFLAVGIGATFLLDRIFRMRQLAELRVRFAADLHDELGADLHVIGLLSDLAQSAVNSPEKLESMHQRIRTMTQRSSDAVRYCTNMLEAKGLYGDLLDDMQRSTERIMADFEGELTVEDDDEILCKLKPRTRADLFLFYKESLVNISRHSNATHFSATLKAHANTICLTVCDDGSGLADTPINGLPSSLMRRAKLLRAKVNAEQPESGGTCISLKMKIRKWGFRK